MLLLPLHCNWCPYSVYLTLVPTFSLRTSIVLTPNSLLNSPIFSLLPNQTYLDYFSRSIEYEYKDKGIIVQSLLPSYVATKMTDFGHKMPRTSFLIPSACVYARHALSTLGVSNRTTGYWPHTLQVGELVNTGTKRKSALVERTISLTFNNSPLVSNMYTTVWHPTCYKRPPIDFDRCAMFEHWSAGWFCAAWVVMLPIWLNIHFKHLQSILYFSSGYPAWCQSGSGSGERAH